MKMTNSKSDCPIKKGLLELMLFEVERIYLVEQSQPYLIDMYTAFFCLSYYGMMRVGELSDSQHSLKAGDVHVNDNQDGLLVVLYISKTHGEESKPQKIRISAVEDPTEAARHHRFFCPVKAVLQFMITRGNFVHDDEPFFRLSDGSPLKGDQVRVFIRTILQRLGLDGALYDVHSFRIGRTKDLWKYGYSIEEIKAMGRWKSNAVHRYLRD